jgi:hypothetical protein
MNHFGASEGESPRPWWRSRFRHAEIQRDERIDRELSRSKKVPPPTDPMALTDPDEYERTVPAETRPDWLYGPGGPMEQADKLGFSLDESVRLEATKEMDAVRLEATEDKVAVRALIHFIQDEPDKARALIRSVSRRDKALLDFYFQELSGLVQDEQLFEAGRDRRRAQDKLRSSRTAGPDDRTTDPDLLRDEEHGRDI